MRETDEGWQCPGCGRHHSGLLTCFGPDEPYAWHRATFRARLRGRLTRDICRVSLEGVTRFYVRGHLAIPLAGHPEPNFIWNVWAEVRREDYERTKRHWHDPKRTELPPMRAVLDTPLPYEPGTEGLAVEVHERPPGNVPSVILRAEPDHPLQRQQSEGIDLHRLAELNDRLRADSTPIASQRGTIGRA